MTDGNGRPRLDRPDPPPGTVTVQLPGGCLLVLSERVYLAGLKLGKTLRRREALARRTAKRNRDHAPTAP